jgi:hypothetical protein
VKLKGKKRGAAPAQVKQPAPAPWFNEGRTYLEIASALASELVRAGFSAPSIGASLVVTVPGTWFPYHLWQPTNSLAMQMRGSGPSHDSGYRIFIRHGQYFGKTILVLDDYSEKQAVKAFKLVCELFSKRLVKLGPLSGVHQWQMCDEGEQSKWVYWA